MFKFSKTKIKLIATTAMAAAALTTAGVAAFATTQSTTSVTALDQTVNTKLSASEKLPTKLYSTATKLSVSVSGTKDNYTVSYTKDNQVVLQLQKQTKVSDDSASAQAKPAVANPGGSSVSLTSKAKSAVQQGLMGQIMTTWKNGNWQITTATVTASNNDPTTVAKTLSSQLTANLLPTTDAAANIMVTVGASNPTLSDNKATWADGNVTYTMTATNYQVLVNALTSFK